MDLAVLRCLAFGFRLPGVLLSTLPIADLGAHRQTGTKKERWKGPCIWAIMTCTVKVPLKAVSERARKGQSGE